MGVENYIKWKDTNIGGNHGFHWTMILWEKKYNYLPALGTPSLNASPTKNPLGHPTAKDPDMTFLQRPRVLHLWLAPPKVSTVSGSCCVRQGWDACGWHHRTIPGVMLGTCWLRKKGRFFLLENVVGVCCFLTVYYWYIFLHENP